MLDLRTMLQRVQGKPRLSALVAVATVAATTTVVLAVQGIGARSPEPPRPAAGPSVTGVFEIPPLPADKAAKIDEVYRPTATTWPRAASASVAVKQEPTRADGTPVWAQALSKDQGPAKVDVQVLDHQLAVDAGISGVLFSVRGQGSGDGEVKVGLDYAAFAQAYGGDYGSRLRLVAVPECAATTPQLTECRQQTPLRSANDTRGLAVSAAVRLRSGAAPTLLAVTSVAAADGGAPTGSFAATSLTPSGSWTGGSSTGAFGYAYPIGTPPSPGSLSPNVDLSYSSSSVDGRTATTQAQASWLGDGWSVPESFVEQTFVSCSESPGGTAAPVATVDQCYAGPILTLSLNGSSSSLVWDATNSVWKPQTDNGAVVTRVTGSGNGSGTYNTDYWVVTQRDGTVYQFGRNQLPGWVSGNPATNSVDSSPVYAAHAGEPCYNATFSLSVCTMAYRWNLDYVTDLHGSAMAYYYKQDTNYYASYLGATKRSYIRASRLDHIDYGFTDTHAYGAVANKVVFGVGDRCVSGTCTPLNSSTKANWPDVPFDLICSSTATCTSQSPAFFSTERLTSITTQQYDTGTSQFVPVDTYAFTHTMPPAGSGLSPTLWLSQLVKTGSDLTGAGSTVPIAMPPVTFGTISLANRTDTANLPAYYRHRIGSITTETGSIITPTYALINPCVTPVTINPAANTSSCYPVSWTPDGYGQPIKDWFNKYVVTKVTQTDRTGGAPAASTSYIYSGGAAWHYDDNEVVKAKYRTYGQFRGYGDVQTLTGDGVNDPQTQSRTTYYRGMSKNNNTTVVNLTDSLGGVHEDIDELAGNPLESTAYLGKDGPVDSSNITSFWVSDATATRNRTGLPALTARRTGLAKTYTRQAITGTGPTTWQYLQTDNSYDGSVASPTFGLLQRVYTHTSPVIAAYDQCETNTYAPVNTTKNLVGLIAETETVSKACGGFTAGANSATPASFNTLTAPASVSRPAQVIGVVRTFYDDENFSTTFPQAAAPIRADPTMTRKAAGYTAGAYTFHTVSRSKYDSYGRANTVYDGNGNATTMAYTMNSVGLNTAMTVTDPLGHAKTTTVSPRRGLVLGSVDANSVSETYRFDALGRATATWTGSRPTSAAADSLYTYDLSNTGQTAVTTQVLNDSLGYSTSTLIYDSLLRPRQTQVMTPKGGRLVSDTVYDSRGWTTSTNNGWWDAATLPNTTPVSAVALTAQVPRQSVYTYDGLGRTVRDVRSKNGLAVSTTTTVRNGDRTTVIPPTGAVTTTTVLDIFGRTVEVSQYSTAPTVNVPANTFTGTFSVTGGTKVTTTWGYDSNHNRSTFTDAASNVWTSTYNLLGQVTDQADVDAGTSHKVYDGNGNVTQSTDSRSQTVSYTYDAMNRKTGQYNSTVAAQSAANRTDSWVYDNSDNAVPGMPRPIGHATTTTAYRGGSAYTTQAKGFNVYGGSTGETITIPGIPEGALGGSYTFLHQYSTNLGLPLKDVYPAKGGLPAETVNYGYAGVFDLITSVGGLTGYAEGVSYDENGRSEYGIIGAQPNIAAMTNVYDKHTGQPLEQTLTRAVGTPADVDKQTYKYDLAGNVTRQTSTRLGAAAPTETQCFEYDGLRRLSAAWTATDACAVTPTAPNHAMVGDSLGAASAYWTTWTFDTLGQRTGQTQHSTTGGTDTSTSYVYNGNGAGQPHTLTSTSTSGPGAGTTSYAYDPAGNTTSRNAGQGSQSLNWNNVGKLTSVTGGTAGNSTFIYDADGGLLLQKDPGTTTLYLPGQQHVLNTTTGVVTGTRYYALPAGGTCVRTGTAANAVTFQFSDLHGTPSLYLDATAQNPTWRQSTPYGAPRGAVGGPWVDNRGFLGKVSNTATGLTQVGARQYDAATGRFISIDPIVDFTDSQTLNGYTYAGSNPITFSDPSGLLRDSDGGEEWIPEPVTECVHMPCRKDGVTRCHTQSASCVGGKSTGPNQVIKVYKHGTVTVQYYGRSYLNGVDMTDFVNAPNGMPLEWWANGAEAYLGSDDNLLAVPYEGNDAVGFVITQAASGGYYGEMDPVLLIAIQRLEPTRKAQLQGSGGQMMTGTLQDVGAMKGKAPMGGVIGADGQCRNSFTGDTLVLMADGSSKRIENVGVGDVVLATEPETGSTAPEAVRAVIVGAGQKTLVEVVVDVDGPAGDTEGVLVATDGHPFWVDDQDRWVDAVDLVQGDVLVAPGGHPIEVARTRVWEQLEKVYNLSVTSIHTYYVLAGTTPVLVHNACPEVVRDIWTASDGDIDASFEKHWKKHAMPLGISREQYAQDAAEWFASNPKKNRKYTHHGVDEGDGVWSVKLKSKEGIGGWFAPDGKTIYSFWYVPEY